MFLCEVAHVEYSERECPLLFEHTAVHVDFDGCLVVSSLDNGDSECFGGRVPVRLVSHKLKTELSEINNILSSVSESEPESASWRVACYECEIFVVRRHAGKRWVGDDCVDVNAPCSNGEEVEADGDLGGHVILSIGDVLTCSSWYHYFLSRSLGCV